MMPARKLTLAVVLLAAILGVIAVVVAGRSGAGRSGEATAKKGRTAGSAFSRPFAPDSTQVESCTQTDQACRAQAIGNIAHRDGPAKAFARVRTLIAQDPQWQADAHFVAHSIGSAALKRNGNDLGLTFTQGDMLGSGGFYHGVIINRLRRVSESQLGSAGAKACAEPTIRAQRALTYKCLHGLGHALMLHTRYDLPLALKQCNRLDASSDRFDCKTGSFMENYSQYIGADPGFASPYIKASDPLYPCNAVDAGDQNACYVQAVTGIGPVLQWNFAAIARTCESIGKAEHVRSCFDSYGLWARRMAVSAGDPTKLRSACAAAGPREGLCVAGAARVTLDENVEDPANLAQVSTLCDSYGPAIARQCYTGAGVVLSYRGQATQRAVCPRLTTKYTSQCLAADGAASGGTIGPIA